MGSPLVPAQLNALTPPSVGVSVGATVGVSVGAAVGAPVGILVNAEASVHSRIAEFVAALNVSEGTPGGIVGYITQAFL